MVAASTMPSVFAGNYVRYAGLGFTPLPIAAGTKAPLGVKGWAAYCTTAPTDEQLVLWAANQTDAGIGLAMGSSVGDLIIIAIDVDVDGDALEKILGSLPDTPMKKVGRKGETRFYRADPSLESTCYNDSEGKRLLDLLATGKQTVIPPTIHPDTAKPYVWLAGPVPADQLPVFGSDARARLHDTLEHLGWRGATEESINEASDGGCGVSSTLNEIALARLSTWVPALGLHKLRLKQNGYEAVAHWRPSSTGRSLDQRSRNLSIASEGIVDFGDGHRGYSAIDLVMAVRECDFQTAFDFLDVATGNRVEDEAYFAPLTEFLERRLAEREAPRAREQSERILGDLPWLVRDDKQANGALENRHLIKGLLPRRGVAILYGQSQAGKGFVTLDMAASLFTGQDFFGHRVKEPGCVAFALGEASDEMPVRMDALRLGRFSNEAPPLHPVSGTPLDLDRLPVAWFDVTGLAQPASFTEFRKRVTALAEKMPEWHGMPLRMVVVDTVLASFGFAKTPDDAEVTNALKALGDLGKELDILFLAVHHAGKNKENGETGSYAFRAAVDGSIFVNAEVHPTLGIVQERRLSLMKLRGGKTGWNAVFDLASVVIGQDDDGDEVDSAVITFTPLPTHQANGLPRLNKDGRAFMEACHSVIEACPDLVVQTAEGADVTVAREDDIRRTFTSVQRGAADTVRTQFRRGRQEALNKGYVGVIPDPAGVDLFHLLD